MKLALFCQIHWLILIFKSDQNWSSNMALQPLVMVAKDIIPSATITEGCKKVILMEFLDKIHIFCEHFKEVVSKMPYWWEIPMKLGSLQLSVTVAKRQILWDFPNIFLKLSWLHKTCNYLGIWQNRANSIFHSSK